MYGKEGVKRDILDAIWVKKCKYFALGIYIEYVTFLYFSSDAGDSRIQEISVWQIKGIFKPFSFKLNSFYFINGNTVGGGGVRVW